MRLPERTVQKNNKKRGLGKLQKYAPNPPAPTPTQALTLTGGNGQNIIELFLPAAKPNASSPS